MGQRAARSADPLVGRIRLQRFAVPFVVVGTVLFVTGLLIFAYYQTQFLFRDGNDLTSVTASSRNDGGILFGGILAMSGLGLGIFALSPLPARRRILPLLGFVGASTLLFFSHFSIYVNSLTIPQFGLAQVEASFLFHDAASSSYIATFSLAMITAVLLLAVILTGLALIVPDVLRDRVTHPKSLEEHRVRSILLTLVLLATGSAFARQFFSYAFNADANPTGSFFVTNMIVIYYTLALAVIIAVILAAVRSYSLCWGDMRAKRSLSYRRSLAYLVHAENWIWGMILSLNMILLIAEPMVQPNRNVDRVFMMSSKGASILFLIVFVIYFLHRRAGNALHSQIRDQAPQDILRRDRFTTLAVLMTVVWVLAGALLALGSGISPLTRMAIKTGALAMILPFFAVRFDVTNLTKPHLRSPAAPLLLIFSSVLGILAGIMLWGMGNTVITSYSPNGGFIHEGHLASYAIGIRALGSLFIAVPTTFALWYITTRFDTSAHPGPLLVVCFSMVIAMNLLLTVNAGDTFDASVRQTEVLIGFGIIGLSAFDQAVVLAIWSATTTIGFVAGMMLLARGANSQAFKRREKRSSLL